VSRHARRDLDRIWRFTARQADSEAAANRVVGPIEKTFRLFTRTPQAGVRRDDLEAGLRSFPSGNYLIYYRDTPKGIVIARVIHAARDQHAAFLSDE